MKKKINYNQLEEIVVKNQQELDDIPLDFKGRIYIEFGDYWNKAIIRNNYCMRVVARENSSVVARENSSVEAWENSSVVARENSSVVARGNSSVEARENSSVEAKGNSSVVARENSSVVARENSSVVARENSSVEAWENSSVVARENSSVVARENSSVEARENSSVEAKGNSSVEAWENSSVVARGNSSVVAWENSSVVARENSSVVARGNSSVEARENSSVEAKGNSSVSGNGNTQIVNCTDNWNKPRIKISGNSRIVYYPKNINEFMDFYGIKYTKTKAIFYKAVRKIDNRLVSNYDTDFEYIVGEIKKQVCDTNVNETCSNGIHIAHLNWALQFGSNDFLTDMAIIEVETKIKDIVLPVNSDGKVRTSEVKVLREVPLSECGLYGQMLEKRR